MSHTQTYTVRGMHCASCSAVIEKTLKKTDGVLAASASYGTEAVKITFDETKTTPEQLSMKIEPFGYSLVVPITKEKGLLANGYSEQSGFIESKKEKELEIKDMWGKVLSSIPLVSISVFVMVWEILAQYEFVSEMSYTISEFFHHLLPLLATYMLFVVGKPYLLGLYRFLQHGKANMDTLIGIGTVAAYLYSAIVTAFEGVLAPYINIEHTYYDVTIVVIGFVTFGKYLEIRSKQKTGEAISKLLELQAKTALVVRGGVEIEIPIGEVLVGDIIIVKPGGKIPVDGKIIQGTTSIDESMISGESIPVDRGVGDLVIGATQNKQGSIQYEATKVGGDTLLAQIIRMVAEAQGSKAPIQALADRISSVFVPVVFAIAFITLAVWLTLGVSVLGSSLAISYGILSFVGVLVIACPCALGLATPTAIIAGVGKGAEHGILIKDAESLEILSRVDTIVMDKTGTITKGTPEVTDVVVLDGTHTEAEVLNFAGSIEKLSEHPLAEAIVKRAEREGSVVSGAENFVAYEGVGVEGFVGSVRVRVTKPDRMEMDKNRIALESEGKTVVVVYLNEIKAGYIALADTLKDEAEEAVLKLQALGIKVVMLTGDNERVAQHIASAVHIDTVLAEVLPAEKASKIESLQREGHVVAMVGDGINDAPALTQANVGIAMATGTDIAIESAGITLLKGDITKIAKAVVLGKKTMRTVKQNLFWAFIYNIVGIPVAAGVLFPIWGIVLNPVLAGLAMAGSSVSVVLNALRLKATRL